MVFPAFIRILNKIRNDEIGEDDLVLLNNRVDENISLENIENHVILTPTNSAASNINERRLNKLKKRL